MAPVAEETPPAVAPEQAESAAWARPLEPIVIRNSHTLKEARIRLYRDDGTIDEAEVREFARIASSNTEPHELELRTVQLAIRAAYHFRASLMIAVSAYRPQGKAKRGNPHSHGEALDFQLPGIKAAILASHLRSYARVGVGIYTHPRTQYVHLDVRDQSFHWLDASPPGRSWRERGIPDSGRAKRDAAWSSEADLPIGSW